MKQDEIADKVAIVFKDDMQASKRAASELLTQFLVNVQTIADALKPRIEVGLAPRADESKG